MNKKELIEELTKIRYLQGNYNDYPLDSKERINAVGNFEGITAALELIDQLDEPEITEEHVKPVIPPWVADIIENNRISRRESPSNLWQIITRDKRFSKWFSYDLPDVSYCEVEEIVLTAILFGYTTEEPPKTLQVIIKNYDSTVFTTELPEDEARKLIEGWKGNE